MKVFSGIQPTGALHLGNYFGAIRNWTRLQNAPGTQCTFSIVDLHALTTAPDPSTLRQSTRDMAAALLACGIDPDISTLYVQSHIPQHAQLQWILGCHVKYGQLLRMTQWKDKAGEGVEKSGFGLFSYPVLQAADILLFQADAVPVGLDQKQHLELVRNIAISFNKYYSGHGDFNFVAPEPLFNEWTKVQSLKDPLKKMSKSDPVAWSRISITDTPDMIRKSIRKAVTDSELEITYSPDERPGVANLLNIYSAVTGQSIDDIVSTFSGPGRMSAFKSSLVEAVVELLTPIRIEYERLQDDHSHLDDTLKKGTKRAHQTAAETMKKVNQIVGIGG